MTTGFLGSMNCLLRLAIKVCTPQSLELTFSRVIQIRTLQQSMTYCTLEKFHYCNLLTNGMIGITLPITKYYYAYHRSYRQPLMTLTKPPSPGKSLPRSSNQPIQAKSALSRLVTKITIWWRDNQWCRTSLLWKNLEVNWRKWRRILQIQCMQLRYSETCPNHGDWSLKWSTW